MKADEMKLVGQYRVTKILKKTTARVFTNLKVGHEITIIKNLCTEGRCYSGKGRGSDVIFQANGEESSTTLRQVEHFLKCFEWEEL